MSNIAPSRADPVVVFPLGRWCPPQETSQPHPPPITYSVTMKNAIYRYVYRSRRSDNEITEDTLYLAHHRWALECHLWVFWRKMIMLKRGFSVYMHWRFAKQATHHYEGCILRLCLKIKAVIETSNSLYGIRLSRARIFNPSFVHFIW